MKAINMSRLLFRRILSVTMYIVAVSQTGFQYLKNGDFLIVTDVLAFTKNGTSLLSFTLSKVRILRPHEHPNTLN